MELSGRKGNKPRKPKIMDVLVEHIDGLPYPEGFSVLLWTPEKNFTILPFHEKKKYPKIELSYKQIKKIEIIDETQVLEVDKNAIGRAIAGGLFLGGLGATIGAISGVGTKRKKISEKYLVINYVSIDSQETKAISFKAIPNGSIPLKLVNELRFRAGLLEENEGTVEPPQTLRL